MKHIMIRGLAAVCLTTLIDPGCVNAQTPGTLDPSFGIGGRMTIDFNNGHEYIHAITALKDGHFLAAGYVNGPNVVGPGGSPNFGVARFLPDGRLDPAFGIDGAVELDINGGVDAAYAMTTLPDRSILLAGALSPGAYSDFGIAKLRPDGSPDTNFGRDGDGARLGWNLLDTAGPNLHDEAVAVAVQSTGKIVVAGVTRVPVGNFYYPRVAVARFTADGQVDTTFGGNGTGFVVLDAFQSPDGSDYATAIALNSRGRLAANDSITVVGQTFARNNAFVARLTANGLIDTSFGAVAQGGGRTGRVTFSHSQNGGVHQGVSQIASARLLAGGRIAMLGTGGDRGLTFMRLNADGTLDTTFGDNGRTTVKFSGVATYDEPAALAVQGNGRLVGAGYATNASGGSPQKDFFVVRLNADGTPDPSFGDGQARAVVTVAPGSDEAYALAVEPSGNLLVGGYANRVDAAHTDFALLRLFGDKDRIFFHDFELPPE